MQARNYRTGKGTELPLLNLRGKQYLEVKYRLVWFREEHPTWSIETQLDAVTEKSAYAKATIRDDSGRIIATSHKFENVSGFPDFIEKAETGAIGRALALIGYGTQFCADELDEGKRIVDAPVESRRMQVVESAPKVEVAASTSTEADPQSIQTPEPQRGVHPGEYTIMFGRKYKGKKLKEIPESELRSYLEWLESSAVRGGTSVSFQVQQLKTAFKRLHPDGVELTRANADEGTELPPASH